jgi:hypothetical protein
MKCRKLFRKICENESKEAFKVIPKDFRITQKDFKISKQPSNKIVTKRLQK